MTSIYLQFYGCQANLDDGLIIKGILERENYKFTDKIENADVCIIGTCIVKPATANKILNILKEIYNKKKLIIAGCMSESETNYCKKLFPKASLVNTYNLTNIPRAVKDLLNNKISYYLGKRREIKLKLPKSINKDVVTIQIASGCTSNCYYCGAKLAKGHIQSYPEKLIVEEIEYYIKKGIKKFNLSSTNNSDYGSDIKTNLPNLLNKIILIKGDFRIRVGMMNPKQVLNFLDELIEVYKNDKIQKFLHVPVQSGSDKVLKEMNRNYKVKDFINIVNKFRKEIPEINIATDIIVGYPTETEEDFKESINLIKKIKPEVLNISKFGARPGTQAAKLKPLKSEIVKERSVRLTRIYKKK